MNKKTCISLSQVIGLTLALATFTGNQALAEPAKICMSQVIVPAQYQTTTEAVTIYEGTTNYTMTPVRMGHGERRVKVADAYVEYEIIPAVFQEITEEIEVERERVEIETIATTYRTETKRIKVKDATIRWNPNCPAVVSVSQTDIPKSCLTNVPAEYTEVTRELIDQPARTVKKLIPGKTKTVTRKVMVEPAKVVRKEIPAVYASIPLARVDEPAKLVTSRTESRVQNLPSQTKVRVETFRQMPAWCESTVSSDDITLLQEKLQQGGYYEGTPDGVLGPKTRTAVTRFQEDNQLASGAITLETLQKLQLR